MTRNTLRRQALMTNNQETRLNSGEIQTYTDAIIKRKLKAYKHEPRKGTNKLINKTQVN